MLTIMLFHYFRFVEIGTLLFGRLYLFNMILSLIFLSIDFLYFFQLLAVEVTVEEAIRVVLYITGNVLTIYACMYFGQRLMDHSIYSYTGCCLIPFYTLSTKTNKLLLLLLTRSMKPCKFSVGGVAVASHELFTKFHTLLTSDFKMDTIVEIMQTFLPTLSFAFVYGNVCSNSTTIKSLIDLVRYKWEKTVNEEELRSIRKYYVQTKFYTVIMTCKYENVFILYDDSTVYGQ
ncbi:hypothetical protein KPH14_006863 [Odynerus spinipes]|uniref:Uncharacterized protein n=1 Tax=Odynerus spinipes TaxID=1348599 RepID=A0AAD9RRP6_9HYME|nr:hypothetical protein KPH14_006863 [Odynerus spinipes]